MLRGDDREREKKKQCIDAWEKKEEQNEEENRNEGS